MASTKTCRSCGGIGVSRGSTGDGGFRNVDIALCRDGIASPDFAASNCPSLPHKKWMRSYAASGSRQALLIVHPVRKTIDAGAVAYGAGTTSHLKSVIVLYAGAIHVPIGPTQPMFPLMNSCE